MRKSVIIGGISALAIIAGTASPAFAAGGPSTPNQPVHAVVQVQTTITISGVTASLDFGQIIPGQAKTLTGAESITVTSNDSRGAAILVQPENGGFHVSTGQPDIIPDSAVSITAAGKTVSIRNDGTPVDTADVATGTHTSVQDWTLNVDSSTPAGDQLFADFSYSALAG